MSVSQKCYQPRYLNSCDNGLPQPGDIWQKRYSPSLADKYKNKDRVIVIEANSQLTIFEYQHRASKQHLTGISTGVFQKRFKFIGPEGSPAALASLEPKGLTNFIKVVSRNLK